MVRSSTCTCQLTFIVRLGTQNDSRSVLPEIARKEINGKMINKNIARVLFSRGGGQNLRKFDNKRLAQIRPQKLLENAKLGRKDKQENVINDGFKKRLISTSEMLTEQLDYYNPKYLINQANVTQGEYHTSQDSPAPEPSSAHHPPHNVSRLNLEKVLRQNTQEASYLKSKQFIKKMNKRFKKGRLNARWVLLVSQSNCCLARLEEVQETRRTCPILFLPEFPSTAQTPTVLPAKLQCWLPNQSLWPKWIWKCTKRRTKGSWVREWFLAIGQIEVPKDLEEPRNWSILILSILQLGSKHSILASKLLKVGERFSNSNLY